jgi:hypothetical protein
MATDTLLLMGEVIEDPDGQERDVEMLLANFLRALIDEQRLADSPAKLRENL